MPNAEDEKQPDQNNQPDVHNTSWRELLRLLLVKLTTSKPKSKKMKTLFLIVLVIISIVFSELYFKLSNLEITTPGTYRQASVMTNEEKEDDPINLLSVRSYPIDSLADYYLINIAYFKYWDYIDKKVAVEPITYPTLSLGSPLYEMQLSAYLAVKGYIGEDIDFESKLIVTDITLHETTTPTILPADEIVSIDGKPVTEALDVEIAKFDFLDKQVGVKRAGELEIYPHTLAGVEVKKNITLRKPEDYQEFYDFANISLEGFEGRSAGTALALSYYNSNVEDVAQGREIALTGTINEYGEVGAIAGVTQKTISAIQNGADIMFVPYDNEVVKNYSEAKEVVDREGSDMKLIRVKAFSEIIDYLKR